MEGILEKPSRIPGKKTKVWSILDESTLSFFRENKRSSCIGSIDLSDIQLVRITSNCQFEIKTEKNSQVYTAESNEKCSEWVQKLSEYSKCTTTNSEPTKNTPRKNSIFSHREEIGEHTVVVNAAKNIFENNTNGTENRRVVSGVLSKPSQEPSKPTRKSDPTKLHPWSTITEAKTHLHHVSIELDTEKKTDSLSKKHENLKNSLEIKTKITTDSKPYESVQNSSGHNLTDTKFGSLEPEAKGTPSPKSLMDSVDGKITTDITEENNENILEEKSTNEDSTSTVSKMPEIASASDNPSVLKTENSENKRDSGYSTTVGEGDRNSHENKVDETVSSETKRETEQTKNGNSTVTVEETNNNQNDVNTSDKTKEHQDGDEEPIETRVIMRKSRSVVSVSHDDIISVVDIDNQECKSQGRGRTCKTTQEQNPSENIDMKYKPSIDTVENSKTNTNTNTLPNFQNKKEVSEMNSASEDAVDGAIGCTVEPVPLRHEIVENYIDIDKIICQGNFPNVPVLPNNAPNRHDLVSFHELKDLLESHDESSDEHSDIDDSITNAEDPIQRLLRMVEV
ncbi:uncharacterized protein LOC127709711 isoform X2 [Mytilus californianus]|uniref:uncharacterized protein LOC127709704 isoform X3 n=1 Tax=Mytilus californianus TaxID=6549 RepID=UPI0022484F15|nr:uncharacterized protein LOC127709704 isoform X3 [Mytilus californianus]XP_052071333.1 uncharacterized protein LOC127709711 isoform X2 [Mytilus californianus]